MHKYLNNILRSESNRFIKDCIKKLISLNIPRLNSQGIRRNIVCERILHEYPPTYLQEPIRPSEIFKDYNKDDENSKNSTKKDKFALYFHIPFCRNKCAFCCYRKIIGETKELIERYVRSMITEIKLISKLNHFKGREVDSIHFGGGTPTVLSNKHIESIMVTVKDNFRINGDIETTIETTPKEIDNKKLECLKKLGFNRISIGVQSFSDKVLQKSGREYRFSDVSRSFKIIKEKGIDNINMDFIYGMAFQTYKTWEKTLSKIEEIKPDSVCAYGFMDDKNNTIMTKEFSNNFPEEEERLLMYVMFVEKMISLGYIQVSPYQFIRSIEKQYQHQEHKSQNKEIYALGISGHSYVNYCDFHNTQDIKEYIQMLYNKKLPISIGKILISQKDKMRRDIIFGLQKRSGITDGDRGFDKKKFYENYHISASDIFKKELERLSDIGLIKEDDRFINLTYQGMIYPTEACRFFYKEEDKKALARLNL